MLRSLIQTHPKFRLATSVFAALGLLLCLIGNLLVGEMDINLLTIVKLLIGDSNDLNTQAEVVLIEIRLPRTIMAILVGASLAAAGAALQTLFRNPLADPGLIGVSSGAALGAVASLVFWPIVFQSVPQASISYLFSFVGGLGVSYLVLLLGKAGNTHSIANILLAGVAINAIALALIGLAQSIADNNSLRSLVFWMLGSLNGASWQELKFVTPIFVVGLILLLSVSHSLNSLLLGENEAAFLGEDVGRLQFIVLTSSTLLVASTIASVGIVAFIGLVVPQILRTIVGSNNRILIPLSAWGGACLVLLADACSRTLLAPSEIPLGIISSLIGGPFFIYLLLVNRRKIYV